jgi:hypothetical protein
MKRSEALTPLSHEHHHALVIAKRLQDAGKKSPEALINYWQEVQPEIEKELLHHFEEEEAGFGDLLRGGLKAQFLADHKQLRALLKTEQPEEILQFAQQLKDHVRFEEREMFMWLETYHPQTLQKRLPNHVFSA